MSRADFLLELLCEEIPARMQAGARAELRKMLAAELDKAGIAADSFDVWSTPRRLALVARRRGQRDRRPRQRGWRT